MNKTNDKTKKMASNIMKSLSRTDFAKFSEDDMKIIKSFAEMICSEEDLSCIDSLFLDKLPYAFKDKFYRRIWTEHVKKDVLSMYDVTDEKAASVVGQRLLFSTKFDFPLTFFFKICYTITSKCKTHEVHGRRAVLFSVFCLANGSYGERSSHVCSRRSGHLRRRGRLPGRQRGHARYLGL